MYHAFKASPGPLIGPGRCSAPQPATGCAPGNPPRPPADGRASAAAHFPLTMAGEGARVRVVALMGGAGLDRRKTQMGINVGAELRVVLREGGGLVVMRGETRFALGGGMAHRIMVAPIESNTNQTR